MKNVKIEKNGLLKIKCNTGSDCGTIVETIKKSYNKCQSNKIFIETCTDCKCVDLSTLEQFDVGKKMANYFSTKDVRIGVYGNCNIFTYFTETVAINRGAQMKVSNNREELHTWLQDN